jgi:hypothetical protein
MRTYWWCQQCVAGGTENAASTMAQGHTKRTQHPTMGTTNRRLWLTKMRSAQGRRGEDE